MNTSVSGSAPISSIMEKTIIPVNMDDTLSFVEKTLAVHGITSAPVVEPGGDVIGIITSRDIAHFRDAGKDPMVMRAWEACRYKPIVVRPERPLADVADLMVENHIHYIVVVDDGLLCGIVSSLDFARLYMATDRR